MAKPILKLVVTVVVLLVSSALTLAGLKTLGVNSVPVEAPPEPSKPPPKPECWTLVPESDEKGRTCTDRRRQPPTPKDYLVREGQGRVMPCEKADEIRKGRLR